MSSASPISYITRCAAEAALKLVGSDENFGEIAAEILANDSFVSLLDPEELLPHIIEGCSEIADLQVPGEFSDLQLILYADEQVEVQLLYWLSATTSVHNHGFDGAFRVIEGRSIHSRFEFTPAFEERDGLVLGQLSLTETELLEPGAIRRISSGFENIHSVYHLGFPSVTLLIATARSNPKCATYEFRGGGVAVDRSKTDLLVIRQVQALRILARTGAPFVSQLISWMELNGPSAAYWGLRALDPEISALDTADRSALEAALFKHPELAMVLHAIRREKIIARLVNLRTAISDETARLILALFMNVPDAGAWPAMAVEFMGLTPQFRSKVEHALATIFAAPAWRSMPEAQCEELCRLLIQLFSSGTSGEPVSSDLLAALQSHPLAEMIGLGLRAHPIAIDRAA